MKPLVAQKLTIEDGIDKGKVGWGVTDGKKWHAYAFATQEEAEKLISNIPANNQQAREVNVGYPKKYVMLKKAK